MFEGIDMNLVERVVKYFNENCSTVRATAKHFGIGHSSVHRYLTEIKPNAVSTEILRNNKAEAPMRGGQATKNKYKSKRSE